MADRFDRFTDRARKVLSDAQGEAHGFGHNYIGTEHLLLGLLHDQESAAGRVLRDAGVSLDRVRPRVEAMIGRGAAPARLGQIGLTPRAKKVIELAVAEARLLQRPYVGTEHLLLGLISEGEGIAFVLLQSMGVSVEQIREQALQIPSNPHHEGEARGGVPPTSSDWVQVLSSTSGATSASRTFSGPPASGPRLRDLLQVIPVAQSQVIAGITVTLLSLETYTDGFLANFRVLVEPVPTEHRLPQLVLEATDDQGNRYNGRAGSGAGDREQWRLMHRFTPALVPDAQELPITVMEVRWRTPGSQPEEQVQVGPWAFAVPLPGRDKPQ